MRVLVTRPKEDAHETAMRLRSRGHSAVLAPLLEVRFREGTEPDFTEIQAIAITSANGVRALVRRTQRRDMQIFAVGPRTAAAATQAGFTDVRKSQGDAAALADAIAAWTTPRAGALLHVAGNEATSKFANRLAAHGFNLRREVLYDVVPADRLQESTARRLRGGEIDSVLLYSPLSAQTFVRCVNSAGLADACRGLIAVCISAAASGKCASFFSAAPRVPALPSETGMLDLLAL